MCAEIIVKSIIDTLLNTCIHAFESENFGDDG